MNNNNENEEDAQETAGQTNGTREAPDSWVDALTTKEETAFASELFSSADALVEVHTTNNTYTGFIRTRTARGKLHVVVTDGYGSEVIIPHTAVKCFEEVEGE